MVGPESRPRIEFRRRGDGLQNGRARAKRDLNTYIVIKDGRHVIGGELVGRVRDEEAGLRVRAFVVRAEKRIRFCERGNGEPRGGIERRTFPTAPSPTTYVTKRADREGSACITTRRPLDARDKPCGPARCPE